MNTYQLLKHVHLTTVAVTLVLFVLRGVWMMLDSPRLQRRWVKVLPHVNDTILLVSALWMAVGIWRYPMVFHGWITAKIVALLVYIVLGTVALKRGRSKTIRGAAFIGGLAVFAYIVQTAYSKSVLPF
ncbi:SirB2 family protein [Ectothiorhodospiraceae bacterium WFHF3C12]|nr:SirB2 family protein [Ectothiorhodospiraceae bacterium WFHF3C12]